MRKRQVLIISMLNIAFYNWITVNYALDTIDSYDNSSKNTCTN